jgi:membrane fusion protein
MPGVISPLFRPEAVAARGGAQLSRTPLPLAPGTLWITALVVMLALALAALLFCGEYAPKDTVRGYITTSDGDVRVYAPGAGTIRRLLVREGERVDQGAALLELDTARTASRSQHAQAAVLQALLSEKDLLETDLQNAEHALDFAEQRLADEVGALEHRIEILAEQDGLLEETARLAQRDLERLSNMGARNYVSAREEDLSRSRILEIELRGRQLAADRRQAEHALEAARWSMRNHPHERTRRLVELKSALRRLEARIAEARDLSRQIVTAPAAGIVSGLLVREGQTVSAASALLSVVPAEARYLAELLIPTRSIAFVRRGAEVKIRYDALPYQKYGTVDGTVRQVSLTTILPGEKSFPLPVVEAVYLAEVDVAGAGAGVSGSERLQSGMTLTADVLRDRRRLVDWLFEPIAAARSRL